MIYGPPSAASRGKLSALGYIMRWGSDHKLHLMIKSTFGRGSKAICGHTASRLDIHLDKPICPDCANRVAKKIGDQFYLIPADILEVDA